MVILGFQVHSSWIQFDLCSSVQKFDDKPRHLVCDTRWTFFPSKPTSKFLPTVLANNQSTLQIFHSQKWDKLDSSKSYETTPDLIVSAYT